MLIPDSSLPKHWPRYVRSAFVHAVALAHRGVTYSRSWAADSPLVRVRLASKLEQAHNEIALLREEMRIKDSRWTKIDARRRPHYLPAERLAILALRTARAWSAAQTARAFFLEPETIAAWLRRIDEDTDKAIVKLNTPINKFPEFVTQLVQRLRTLCPAMGKKRIAQYLAASGLLIGPTSVFRMLRRPSHPPPREAPPATSVPDAIPQTPPSPQRTVTAKRPHHVWNLDLTAVPTLRGFWIPWTPFALPQAWPFCWWVAVAIDHFSRAVVGMQIYRKPPSANQIATFLENLVRSNGSAPRHLITDKGSQFTSATFVGWCKRLDIRQRFGAVGRYGSIAIVERFIRSFKSECVRRILVPLCDEDFQQEIALYCIWYNRYRPHQGLGGSIPNRVYRPDPPLQDETPKRGNRRDLPELRLSVSFIENRSHLPIVELRNAA